MSSILLFLVTIVTISFYTDAIFIKQCPAGFYCPKGGKLSLKGRMNILPIPCPRGTYSGVGQQHCTPCSIGYFTNATGSIFCTGCPPGSMCPRADEDPIPCPVGTYASCLAKRCCTACPPGTYNFKAGSMECIQCPPGTKCPTNSSDVCGEFF